MQQALVATTLGFGPASSRSRVSPLQRRRMADRGVRTLIEMSAGAMGVPAGRPPSRPSRRRPHRPFHSPSSQGGRLQGATPHRHARRRPPTPPQAARPRTVTVSAAAKRETDPKKRVVITGM